MSPRRNVPGLAGGISKAWRKPSPWISGTSSLHSIAVAQQRVGRIQPQAHSLAFLGLPPQEANAGDRWARVSVGPRGNPKAGHGRARQHSVAQVPPSKWAFPSLSPGKMLPRANPAVGRWVEEMYPSSPSFLLLPALGWPQVGDDAVCQQNAGAGGRAQP